MAACARAMVNGMEQILLARVSHSVMVVMQCTRAWLCGSDVVVICGDGKWMCLDCVVLW